MFARVSRFEGGSSEDIDESVKRAEDEVLPAAAQLDGYKGAIFLVDRDAGNSLAVTLWETEEAMSASEERANQLRQQALAGEERIAGVERYEVAINALEG